jgi:hypothetical protein
MARTRRRSRTLQRTTVLLPPELKEKATLRAREEGISLVELIRESLAVALQTKEGKLRKDDPLFADHDVFDGEAPEDIAERHDRYLYE